MCSNPQLDWDTVGRRAGGPRKYNRTRQLRAEQRLLRVVEPLSETGFCHGYQTRIAEALNVSRPTICRDMAKLPRRHWGGKEAEERHQGQQRMQRRIQAEERLEQQRVAPETRMPELDPVAAPRLAPPSRQDMSVDAPAFTAPQRLPSVQSKAAEVFRPHGSRRARRHHVPRPWGLPVAGSPMPHNSTAQHLCQPQQLSDPETAASAEHFQIRRGSRRF